MIVEVCGDVPDELERTLKRINVGVIKSKCALPGCGRASSVSIAAHLDDTNLHFCSWEHLKAAMSRWGLELRRQPSATTASTPEGRASF